MARELTELREMDLATLVDELRATKQEALNLRFRNATGHLDDTAAITKAKIKCLLFCRAQLVDESGEIHFTKFG